MQQPVKGATVMLVNDVSASMTATDVKPSRLAAAKRAATSFLNARDVGHPGWLDRVRAPSGWCCSRRPTDHALTRAAIAQLKPGGGGTAMGDALDARR